MHRRNFLTAAAALLVIPNVSVAANQRWLEGELNRSLGTFDWSNGGGDPLQRPWRINSFAQTLAITRLGLSAEDEAGLRATLASAPHARMDLRSVYEGKVVGDVMVSGNGWLALNPRLVSSRWKSGRSTAASWWAWTNTQNGERWEIIVPDVCNNLILTRLGQAVPCVCGSQDACVL